MPTLSEIILSRLPEYSQLATHLLASAVIRPPSAPKDITPTYLKAKAAVLDKYMPETTPAKTFQEHVDDGEEWAVNSILEQAYRDWLSNSAFVGRKTYYLRVSSGRAPKAPWSDLVRKLYKDSQEFHIAANQWADEQGISESQFTQFGFSPRIKRKPRDDAEISPNHACPFCVAEEMAGTIRNHLEFVSKECKGGKLGPATGGMIPKTQDKVKELIEHIERIQTSEHPDEIQQMLKQAHLMAWQLMPKLTWIKDCQRAKEAATLSNQLWHLLAKTTQVRYMVPDGHT